MNDFNAFSHTWQVLIQAETAYRNQPSDINRFYTRAADGTMVPLGTVVTLTPTTGPDVVYRYNRFPRDPDSGRPVAGDQQRRRGGCHGESGGQHRCPPAYSYEWTGTTYQQKLAQGNEGIIFGFAAVLVFLCLAALYESWSIPFAVLLALPLGLFGALLAAYIRNYPYDIYTQIGIVTLIGLAAKNAILIVEFAKDSHEQELMSFRDAAMHAAKLRLRPILMTSFAFILGVVPLVMATGASSASRRSLGTAVFGGMLAATLIAVFLVPVQYYVIEILVERRKGAAPDAGAAPKPGLRAGHGSQANNRHRTGVCRMKRGAYCTAGILAALVLSLTGCMVGPNYKRPAVATPQQFRGAPASRHTPARPRRIRSRKPNGSICSRTIPSSNW